MKITFIGVGAAFSRKYQNSNLLIESGSIKMAVDCGHSFLSSLESCDLFLKDLTHIFVTHLHADHIGGLEELAIMSRFTQKHQIQLVSTPSLLDRLWHCSLKGGLEYIEATPGDDTPQTLDNYFSSKAVTEDQGWVSIADNERLQISLVRTQHVKGMESYGLKIQEEGASHKEQRIFFSGDTKYNPQMLETSSHDCGLIFHDCQFPDHPGPDVTGVHPSYSELLQLPAEIRAKMCLYHYGDEEQPDAEKDGFRMLVQPYQIFDIPS